MSFGRQALWPGDPAPAGERLGPHPFCRHGVPLLARLKADGLLNSEWVEADTSHPRKYYSLTAVGKRRALQMAKAWWQFSATLEDLLSPLLKDGTK